MRSKLRMIIGTGRTRWRALALLLLVTSVSMYSFGVPQRLAAQITEFDFITIRGFRIDTNVDSLNSVDSHWQSLTGGALQVELIEQQFGTDQFSANTSGRSTVSDIVLKGPMTSGSGPDPEVLQNGGGKFTLDIDGLASVNSNVVSITIDPLEIEAIETIDSSNFGFRQFVPGSVIFGEIEIHAARTSDSGEMFDWWDDFAKGQNATRNVTVTALTRDGFESRFWTFVDAVPISYSPIGSGYGPDSPVATESVVLRYSHVLFSEDSRDRQNIGRHINSIFNQLTIEASLSVTEIVVDGSDGRTITYVDAFPTRYVFPSFSTRSDENLTEEVHYKALRLEVID